MSKELKKHDWIKIMRGVKAKRFTLTPENAATVDATPAEMLWATVIEGSVSCSSPSDKVPTTLDTCDSVIMFWPRGPWKLSMYSDDISIVSICSITLEALHEILAAEYHDVEGGDQRFDSRQLTRTVHFSPLRIRDMSRLFIHSHESRFKAIARQGVFLDLFSEMLEMLYGLDMSQCPFQIDSDTERKIRIAHNLMVSDLSNIPDLDEVAISVELPRQVLKEGFTYLYGKQANEYLSDYRFEQARVMLESGKYLIKEVAFQIGYQNPSHFISAFKQRFGTTPKQWVKQQV